MHSEEKEQKRVIGKLRLGYACLFIVRFYYATPPAKCVGPEASTAPKYQKGHQMLLLP